MYYDPMIAKLCTWAPDRSGAIAAMRTALDGFEVEGIGHNLPFLSAVMDHPRFVEGAITTAFIAEEYPDGFQGVALPGPMLRKVAAAAAAMHRVAEIRRARISGTMDNHQRKVGSEWVVTLQKVAIPVTIDADRSGATVEFADGERMRVVSAWVPGQPLARLDIDGELLVLKARRIPSGYHVRVRGAELQVNVMAPRMAALAAHMPEKLPPDTSKYLLCPMPGLVVRIDVAEGDEVFDGQALAMVEAMKMENVLRAERRAKVAKVRAKPGDSLAVDDVILEFE
ncbi:MAG: biotin/lipoyl-containing protein, partial [Amaricoccus sp.]